MKKSVSIILIALLVGIMLGMYSAYGETSDKDKCVQMLNQYGWQVNTTPYDIQKITIPNAFDKVYENYNKLQQSSGFDLLPYRGKSGTRYTFIITNYPIDVGETVYANIITIDGKPVGGDIMTVSLSGFMHGLDEHTP